MNRIGSQTSKIYQPAYVAAMANGSAETIGPANRGQTGTAAPPATASSTAGTGGWIVVLGLLAFAGMAAYLA